MSKNELLGKRIYISSGPDRGEYGTIVAITGYGNFRVDFDMGGTCTVMIEEIKIKN